MNFYQILLKGNHALQLNSEIMLSVIQAK